LGKGYGPVVRLYVVVVDDDDDDDDNDDYLSSSDSIASNYRISEKQIIKYARETVALF
jgi:hypothetical protein